MDYYRLYESTNLKEIGCYPQKEGDFNIEYPVIMADDPRHLYGQKMFTYAHKDIYIPKHYLKKRAKVTDMLSLGIHQSEIISERFKCIIEQYTLDDFQLLPIAFERGEEIYQYYLLRGIYDKFKYNYELIDFEKSIVTVFKSTWEEDYAAKVNNANEFLQLINATHLPYHVKIKRPYFLNSCNKHLLALRYVYNGYQIFVSEVLKQKLEAEKITGVKYLGLDEVL